MTPIEPAAVDQLAHRQTSYHTLRGVSVQDLIQQIRYLPKEAQKHVSILNEARVNRAVNPAVQARLDELKALPDAELSIQLEEYLPSDVVERAEFLTTVASEQARSLSELYDRSRKYQMRTAANKTYHTPSPAFMSTLWSLPPTAEQTTALKAVPEARRQSWFDLTLHYLGVNSAESRFNALETCLNGEYSTSAGRNSLRPRPCAQLALAAESQMQMMLKDLTRGSCEAATKRFHSALVEKPDAEAASIAYQGLLQCSEVSRTIQAITSAVSTLTHGRK